MELKLLVRRRDDLCTPGDNSSAQQGIGQGEGRQKRRTEINTGAGKAALFQGGKQSVNQESEKGGRRQGYRHLWTIRQRGENLQVGLGGYRVTSENTCLW